MDDFTEAEFEEIKSDLIEGKAERHSPHEHPHAYLIVGQPGAGKTTMANIFTNKEQGDVIFISGDDYQNRRKAPSFSRGDVRR